MWHHFTSLRFRLAAVNFAVTAVILFGTTVTILIIRSSELHADLDERLTDRTQTILEDYVRSMSVGVDPPPRRLPAWPGYFIQVCDDSGNPILTSKNLASLALPFKAPARARVREQGSAFETVASFAPTPGTTGFGDIRMLSSTGTDAHDGLVYAQVARSLAPVREAVRNLRNLMLGVVAAGLAIAALASWVITNRMLAPLREISQRAERLSITNLEERMSGGGKDEVSVMAASLDVMLDRLRGSFKAQERFVSAVSHELKTPLSILLGQAQVLSRQTREPEEYERFLAAVQDETRSLSRTVESLLTLARAEAGLPLAALSPVSINEVVMNAVSRCAPIADQQEVKLTPQLAMPSDERREPVIEGDGEMLSLMISNLIRNAVRYAPADSTIDVLVRATVDHVEISVCDRGPGIPAEYIDRVFDRFFQVPRETDSFKGAGIGLTITRGVAELHGGSVRASNLEGGGCEFRVQLPLCQDQLTSAE